MLPPKLAMSMRHLALNSPLGHFNGDNARLSTRRTKLTVTPKFISSNGNMAFAKLQRTQSLARPTIRAVFSTLSYLHFVFLLTVSPTRIAAQQQTTFSMLQIKTIPKKHFDYRHLTSSSFLYYLTNLARKQLNVNTHTLQPILAQQ